MKNSGLTLASSLSATIVAEWMPDLPQGAPAFPPSTRIDSHPSPTVFFGGAAEGEGRLASHRLSPYGLRRYVNITDHRTSRDPTHAEPHSPATLSPVAPSKTGFGEGEVGGEQREVSQSRA
jgi:hypothetical protein